MFFFLCVYVRSLKKARIKEHRGVWRWGCFVKSMNAWNIAVVHLKENASSIKQTWRTGPIHQSAARISYWVQLRRDKCRTSSVCPRLPIDRDHHCDVAFYLTTCSLKLYIIPNTEISKEEEGWEGHEPDCIFYSQNVWALFVQDCFHGFWWSASSRCREVLRLFLLGFRTCRRSLFCLGIIPRKMNISLVNTSLPTEGLNRLNTSLLPPQRYLFKCVKSGWEESLLGCYWSVPLWNSMPINCHDLL